MTVFYFTYRLTEGVYQNTGGSGWLSGESVIIDYQGLRIFGGVRDFQIVDSTLAFAPFVLAGNLLIMRNRVIFSFNDRGSLGYIDFYPVLNDDFLNIRSHCPQLDRQCSEVLVLNPVLDPAEESVSVPEFTSILSLLLLCLLFFSKLLRSH